MKNTIQYDSKSKHSKRRQTVNLGSGMLVFFFPFFENLGSYVYDSMRARTVFVFERHQRSDFFVEKLYSMGVTTHHRIPYHRTTVHRKTIPRMTLHRATTSPNAISQKPNSPKPKSQSALTHRRPNSPKG